MQGGILSTQAKTVLLQGVGAVGSTVLRLLRAKGIDVIAYDMRGEKRVLVEELGATWASSLDELVSHKADLFCPCADGHVLTEKLVSRLSVKSILGAANHQLDCDRGFIEERGIFYYDDYIVNSECPAAG